MIYQIHETSGEWEDYCDRIVGTYSSLSRAEEEKKKLELQNVEDMKCNSCPLYFCPTDCELECNADTNCDEYRINLAKKYCKEFDLDESDNVGCKEFCTMDECGYYISEIEVME